MQKIRKDDEVIVIAGKDKGKTGKVTKVNEKANKISVAGINIVRKSIKPTQENPAGGFAEGERPIHVSNVMLVSPKTNKRTRVRIEKKDGKNVRVAVSCGTVLK